MTEAHCIFCKIIRQEIPCTVVHESPSILAFLDINPVRPGHTLVIPKHHAETMFDLPHSEGAYILEALQKVGHALMHVTSATGVNVIQNNYASSGQEVPHVHWHVIPRIEGDGLKLWNQSAYESIDAMNELAACIRKACV